MPSTTDAIERPFPFLRITSKSIYWKWICSPSFVFSSGRGIWGFCPFQLEPIYLFLSLLWPSRLVWKRFEIVVDQEGGGGVDELRIETALIFCAMADGRIWEEEVVGKWV